MKIYKGLRITKLRKNEQPTICKKTTSMDGKNII
jgi:hypothetical protein